MPRDGSGVYHTPVGTDGVPDTTIESSKYNINVHDIETDLNTPRPIVAGGTGATSATAAMLALSGEIAKQIVTNFNAQVWQVGSFYAESSSTGSPVSGHAFAGIAYYANASDFVIEAHDLSDATYPVYYRIQNAGVWGTWISSQTVADARFVNVTGDTMTGQLNITTAAGNALQFIDTVSGLHQTMRINSNGLEWVNSAYTLVNATLSDAGNFSARGTLNAVGNIFTSAAITATGNITGSRITATQELWSNNGVIRFRGDPTNAYIFNDGTNLLSSHPFYVGGALLSANQCKLNANALAISDGTNYLLRTAGAIYFQDLSGTVWGFCNSGELVHNNQIRAVNNVAAGLDVNASRNVNASGSISANGNVTAGANCYSNYLGHQTNGYYDAGGFYRAVFGAANPNYGGMNIAGVHYPGNFAAIRLDSAGGGYAEFRQDGSAWKNGGGSTWGVISDARIKNVVGDYQSGLDAIAALKPVRYTYKGNASWVSPEYKQAIDSKTETVFVGLLAQEGEATMPELFNIQPGYIDGIAVNDLRSADYSPLTFALVNAIKELKARIEQLEAKS